MKQSTPTNDSSKITYAEGAASISAEATMPRVGALSLSERIGSIKTLRVIFLLSFILLGTYYELSAAIISIALMCFLIARNAQLGIDIYINRTSVFLLLVFAMYLLSSLWAADKGLAIFGAVKFMTLPLIALSLMQISRAERHIILSDIPWIAAGMTVISYVLHFIPFFQQSMSVSGRLAGFFMYPNTFACFVMVGFVILMFNDDNRFPEERREIARLVCATVLVFGFVQAGSRANIAIAIPVVITTLVICIRDERSKKKDVVKGTEKIKNESKKNGIENKKSASILKFAALSILIGTALGVASVLIYNRLNPANSMNIASNANTLYGRLLYWKDALRLIASKPFGMGYLGYYMAQGNFQTGVYSVRFVHNELLQMFADIGWIPGLGAIYVTVRTIISQRISTLQRLVFIAVTAHSMFDFDLQFIAMWFVVILCMDVDERTENFVMPHQWLSVALAAILGAGSVYFGLSALMTELGQHKAAVAIYPNNTLSNIELLSAAKTEKQYKYLAAKILNVDPYVSLAWDVESRLSMADNDFETAMQMKQNAITCNRYNIDGYVEYFEMLRDAMLAYEKKGDTESRDICYEEIASIKDVLQDVEDNTDSLAWKLPEKPQLTMPDEYYEFLEKYGEE